MFERFRGARAIIQKRMIQSFEVPIPVLAKTSNETPKNELCHHATIHTSVLCQSPLPGVAKKNCIAYNQKYHVAQIGKSMRHCSPST
jgi:2-keto-4-pentenoate hydratase/2-oxohepta-3-ene-1,7-dioic acid hydratase in catechol pathway